jgi:PAT family beta-lactamase induction signal transducer AmpG
MRKDCVSRGGIMDVTPQDIGSEAIGSGPSPAAATRHKASLADVLKGLRQPKIAAMLGLGFSSGLPFLLIGATLSYWLGDAHVNIALIGYLSWVGMAWGIKFIWGAVVDHVPPPLFGRLGRRRGWMLWMQIGVAIGLLGMATCDPHLRLQALVAFAVVTSFAGAAQDVVIDAWRIEIASDANELDLLTAAYQLGYHFAQIMDASIILLLASWIGWQASYGIFGVFMAVGLASAILAKEPTRADVVMQAKASSIVIALKRGLDISAGPIIAFFRRFGPTALLILVFVSIYHISDYMRAPVINPFYSLVGLQKAQVGTIRLAIGLPSTFLGIAAGGLFSARFGQWKALFAGAVLQPIAIAALAILVYTGPNLVFFSGWMALDDFSMNFAGVALVAYMSTLTQLGYTATQYALLSSALNWTGKFFKGFSGEIVQAIGHGKNTLAANGEFFLADASLSIGALVFCVILATLDRRRHRGSIPI